MNFIRINKAYSDAVELAPEDFVGKNYFELFPHADNETIFRRVLETGEAYSVSSKPFEYPDRPEIETTYWDWTLTPVKDDMGRIEGVLLVLLDVSEKVNAENQLRKLSQAVEQAGESVLVTDKKGTIEYVNPAFTEITGYSSEEVIGKDPSILKSDAQDPSYYKNLWETVTRGEVWHGTLIDRKKDGSFYPALMSVSPIHDESGETTHYVAIQQDMTEHQKLEEQFQQSQKMEAIGTLVGGIAHDFNNMLAGIMGNLYLAKVKIEDKDKAIEKLDSIEVLSNRAADMIRQLLTFARKDSIKMNSFSLNLFLNEALKLARSGVPEDVRLTYNISPDDLIIHGNATQLQQVIMNLLNNARDAVADVSEPVIDCVLDTYSATDEFREKHPDLEEDRFAHLTVRDNGSGISEAKLDKIFDPFFTTKGVGTGTGLGLSMVYGAIQSHGGAIEVESQPVEGTAFHIYLPLETEKAEEVEIEEAIVAVEGHGETILLVDDDESMRSATAAVLTSLSYKVMEADGGEDALEMFSAHQDNIDLILTDVVMPKVGGVDLAKSIRLLDKNVPVIFATGYDKDQAMSSDDQVTQSIVVNKPFSVVKLSQLIRRMIKLN